MPQAQLNKIDRIIELAELGPNDHVLEIGCGWGGFAIRAVQRTGCRVTGLTLSKEQLAEARARVKAAGLEDKINFMLCDYRDCPGAACMCDAKNSLTTPSMAGHVCNRMSACTECIVLCLPHTDDGTTATRWAVWSIIVCPGPSS